MSIEVYLETPRVRVHWDSEARWIYIEYREWFATAEGPCPVKWCKRDRRHPRVVRFVHAAAVIAGTPSVSMVV
jgi:hypothetical protein